MMFSSSPSFGVLPLKALGTRGSQDSADSVAAFSPRLARLGGDSNLQVSRADGPAVLCTPTVNIAPHRTVSRSRTMWRGMGVELVKAAAQERTDYAFQSSSHLLVAYQQGVRRDGESYVDGLPRSTLRDVAKKLTLVPAGHHYREWHDPRTPTCVTYFYFDPAELKIDSSQRSSGIPLSPRLFFEDVTIWNTVEKLRQAVDAPENVNGLYVEALGTVLLHEILRLNKGASRVEMTVKGGLAAWQQRIVTAYIEEHLSEQVSLATLARLARLSTFHFCRAFKQSFGVPPHRFHTTRRIERAKLMLAERKHSVTEIGLAVGFSETSSFTAVFRKITGQTPSRYHRALG
jgi:AraC family transcriptional regulator